MAWMNDVGCILTKRDISDIVTALMQWDPLGIPNEVRIRRTEVFLMKRISEIVRRRGMKALMIATDANEWMKELEMLVGKGIESEVKWKIEVVMMRDGDVDVVCYPVVKRVEEVEGRN